jgi:hypothetical protein
MALDIHAAALGDWVPGFVRVNNRLAGIAREPTAAEISAHRGLLAVNELRVENLELFVHHVAPGAGLRDEADVPSEEDTASLEALRADLATIVAAARTHATSPKRLHRLYRMLRPFTDANGRCGRALWMWQVMRGRAEDLAEIARVDLSDADHPLNRDALASSTMM